MRAFNKASGMYSCKLAMYVYAVALQMAIGYFLLLCSPNKLNLNAIIMVRNIADINKVGFDILQGAGAAHIVLAALTFCLLVLSHFLTVCFKLPMLLVTIVQTAYCTATAGVCVVYLQKGYFSISNIIGLVKSAGLVADNPMFNNFLVDNRNFLFTIGLLSVIAASLFHQAQVVKGSEDVTHAMVVVPCMTIGLGISFCLTAPCRDFRTFTLGTFWMLVCGAGDVITSCTRLCCLRPFKILMLAVFSGIAILCLITIGLCTTIYTRGNIDYSSYLDIVHGKVKQFSEQQQQLENYQLVTKYFEKITTSYSDEQLNVYMGNGVFFIVIVLLSIVCLVFCLLSLLYSIFRLFDSKRNTSESKGDVKIVVQ
ncbi:putative membrane protein [Babesia divergens]|uniref:Membrane protein n=1 Tax=Babesia divergens TaxID=32595 RepID=A0AAD9LDV8_BABDI|nr:putative membrane protein [Babesia divergens]